MLAYRGGRLPRRGEGCRRVGRVSMRTIDCDSLIVPTGAYLLHLFGIIKDTSCLCENFAWLVGNFPLLFL